MSKERKTVKGERIILDTKEYKDMHFDGCELIITGAGPVRLINCSFGENELALDGAAARTIDTLTGMYGISFFKPFVDAVTEGIRGKIAGDSHHHN